MASKYLLYVYLIVAVLLQPFPPSLGNFLSPLLSTIPGSPLWYLCDLYSSGLSMFQIEIFVGSQNVVWGCWTVIISIDSFSVPDYCFFWPFLVGVTHLIRRRTLQSSGMWERELQAFWQRQLPLRVRVPCGLEAVSEYQFPPVRRSQL